MLLLDTDIMIDVERGFPPALAWLTSILDVDLALPGLVVLELLQGAHNVKIEREVERLTSHFAIYWPTIDDHERAQRTHAAARRTSGIGILDMLIAQTAIGIDATLATFNVRHFARVSDLRIIQPYER